MLVLARAKEAGVGIFGTKAGMTQIFTKDGLALPATVIALEDGNIVTQVRMVVSQEQYIGAGCQYAWHAGG